MPDAMPDYEMRGQPHRPLPAASPGLAGIIARLDVPPIAEAQAAAQ